MGKILYTSFIVIAVLVNSFCIFAQDKRTQYPPFLANSYFSINIGYISYAFSMRQLEPGYTAESVHIPHTAVRVLFGHRFNKYLSAQISYMRPVDWVEYKNVNGSHITYRVGMNVAGLTIKSSLPVSKNISISAEAGLGIITRGGFIVIDAEGVRDASFTGLLLGGGMEYQLNKKWELALSTVWSPAHKKTKQPATIFYSAGFNYTMCPLSKEKVERNANSGFIFPRQLIQAGCSTNALGYGVNNFFSKGAVPIFWGGAIQVEKGLTLNYQRNIFHTRKFFSLDWGAGLSYWKSKENKEEFYTISLYPVFRFTLLRLKSTDLYFNYSFGGPSFISKKIIEEKNTGEKFTFQDFMGLGIFTGKKRNLNAELRIAHYSNGNIFPQNNGVMIPLTLNLGYTFE
jgi:Lipid A 3-O-deacylase (PagL)/OmpA-like transmembrane domain